MAKRGDGGAWKRLDAAQEKAREALGGDWYPRFAEARQIVLAQAALDVRAKARAPATIGRAAKALRLRSKQVREAAQDLAAAAEAGEWHAQAQSIRETRDQAAALLSGLAGLAAELERRAASEAGRGGGWRGTHDASQAALTRYVLGRWPRAPRAESAWAYFAIGSGLASPPGDDLAWRALKASWGAALKRVGQARRRAS